MAVNVKRIASGLAKLILFTVAYAAIWLLLHNYMIAPAQMAAIGY